MKKIRMFWALVILVFTLAACGTSQEEETERARKNAKATTEVFVEEKSSHRVLTLLLLSQSPAILA